MLLTVQAQACTRVQMWVQVCAMHGGMFVMVKLKR